MAQLPKVLQGMTSFLVDFVWPPLDPEDRLGTARRRFVTWVSLLAVCANLFDSVAAYDILYSVSPLRAQWSLWSTLAFLFPPIMIARGRNTRLATWFLLAMVFFTVNLQALSPEGHLWAAAIYLSAMPALITLLFGTRMGALLCTLAIVNVLVLGTLTVPHWIALILTNVMAVTSAGTYLFMKEIEKTTEHLEKLRQEAQAANRAKSFFLANVSHEIRTPLNGIIGAVQLLADHPQNEEQRELLHTAEKSGQTLLRIVNDILDFSRIIEHGLTLEKRVFRREDLVTNVFSALSSQADEKGIKLVASYGEDVPRYLVGDPNRLAQIVMNYVGNAVKFSDHGKVEVRMTRLPGTQMLKVAVIDEGIGLTHEAAQRVFNQFEQAENSTARLYGGTGLGLSIARQLATLHGGETGVSSQLGHGSTFWFTFPLIEGERPIEQVQVSASRSGARFDHARVLLVEDNKTNQFIARKFLARLGVTPEVVADGVEAITSAAREEFDLIFMDIQMPRKTGIEAAEEIRAGSGPNKHTPIVALSANVMADQKDSYARAGMDGCVEKPCKFDDIASCLQRFVPDRANQAAAS
jgi:signal transduction histidine kinase/ActR/RegA family two-component response regulator